MILRRRTVVRVGAAGFINDAAPRTNHIGNLVEQALQGEQEDRHNAGNTQHCQHTLLLHARVPPVGGEWPS